MVATACGWAAVGMRPTISHAEPLAVRDPGRAMTASSSAPDSATKSRCSSGERASAVGLVPRPAARPTQMVRRTARDLRFRTTT